MKHLIQPQQLQKVSEYLLEHNKIFKGKDVHDVQKVIMRVIKRMNQENSTYAGTAGFTVLAEDCGEDCTSYEILVDLAVGTDHSNVYIALEAYE